MKFLLGASMLVLFLGLGAASVHAEGKPPLLTISQSGKTVKTVSLFDKWTQGATLITGDIGTDGVHEIIIGAGPGSAPEIIILRQDGSLINKFFAFDTNITKGVLVGLDDVDGDGKNEIIAGHGPVFGKFVRVFDGYGKLLKDWYPRPEDVSSVLTAVTDDTLSYSVPAPRFTNGKPEIKKIVEVSLGEQRVYTYENGLLADTFLISAGTKKYPTKLGEYKILWKTPKMRYRGPGYDLPNVHWNAQFSVRGDFFHEAYWHKNFGTPMSHGCVNMRLDDAKKIYDWVEIGTPVIIAA
jgi:hypothetical protein